MLKFTSSRLIGLAIMAGAGLLYYISQRKKSAGDEAPPTKAPGDARTPF